jgi:hypothetical protein
LVKLPEEDAEGIDLAVNGTLMRGFDLNDRLVSAGASFVQATRTAECYRLYSIGDQYPAMLRDDSGGTIDVEMWRLPPGALGDLLLSEPPGLCIGRASLADGQTVLAVLGEPWVCEDAVDITAFGGWHGYVNRTTRPAGDLSEPGDSL